MLCSNPLVSIVASAIRINLWANFAKSLENNKVPFEIIFVGDTYPKLIKDDNFRFIYSKVKPSQCYEVGFRAARGKFINWTADDVIYSDGAIDKIYNYYTERNNPKLILAFNCIENNSPTSEGHRIFGKDSNLMAPIGFIEANWLKTLGGYDNKFICGQAENDLVMRAYNDGGIVEICRDAVVYINHDISHLNISKFRDEGNYPYHKHDRQIIEYKWKYGYNSFSGYDSNNIHLHTQGIKGEWDV